MVTVTFKSLINESSLSIDLYSKYTCICGDNSGEGKTHFVSYISDGIETEQIKVSCSNGYEFTIADASTINVIARSDVRQIVLIDEISMVRNIKVLHSSKSLYIGITRASNVNLEYPMQGIYKLIREESDGAVLFDLKHMEKLPLLSKDNIIKFDYIITEAISNRSENELLSAQGVNNLIGSGGRDRLERVLRKYKGKNVLVLADLASIGPAYSILKKRSLEADGLVLFYPYLCFEQLLCHSPLVRSLVTSLNFSLTKYDFNTLEVYYEKLLEFKTRKTNLQYIHGKPLAKQFLSKNNRKDIFSSKVGNLMLKYLDLYF